MAKLSYAVMFLIRAFKFLLVLPSGIGKELAAEEEPKSGNKFTALHLICYKDELQVDPFTI